MKSSHKFTVKAPGTSCRMHPFTCLAKVNESLVFKLWVDLTATFSFIFCTLQVLCTNTSHWPCTSIHSDFIKWKSKVKKEKPSLHGVFPPQNAKTCCYNGMNSLNKSEYQMTPSITRESKQEKTSLMSLYWPKILLPEKTRHKNSTHRRTEVTTSEAPSSPFLTNTAVLATVVTAVCTTACGCWTTCACACACGWAWACCTGGCWGGCWPAWGCWGWGPVCCWALCCSASACKARGTFSLQAWNKQDVVGF